MVGARSFLAWSFVASISQFGYSRVVSGNSGPCEDVICKTDFIIKLAQHGQSYDLAPQLDELDHYAAGELTKHQIRQEDQFDSKYVARAIVPIRMDPKPVHVDPARPYTAPGYGPYHPQGTPNPTRNPALGLQPSLRDDSDPALPTPSTKPTQGPDTRTPTPTTKPSPDLTLPRGPNTDKEDDNSATGTAAKCGNGIGWSYLSIDSDE